MDDFSAASMLAALGDGRYRWDVPDGWQQGKGAFGGLVLGALARAMEGCEPDRQRRLRSLTGDLCAPMLPGPAELTSTILRRGSGATYVEARAVQGGQTIARASALLGVARPPSALRLAVSPPVLPPLEEVAVVRMGQPPTPRFAAHFELRPVGPLPFFGAREPVAAGYLRLMPPPDDSAGPPGGPVGSVGPVGPGGSAARAPDAAEVIALLDAWWPCALVVEPQPRGMATVTFAAELIADPAELDATSPFAYCAELAGAADGYSVELRQLWQGGRLVALNQQVFAAL
ncbi:MAG: thioesterase family protein [Myxococcales bacterium]|nr:thioesterase family protein [Myxococcales bacterium]